MKVLKVKLTKGALSLPDDEFPFLVFRTGSADSFSPLAVENQQELAGPHSPLRVGPYGRLDSPPLGTGQFARRVAEGANGESEWIVGERLPSPENFDYAAFCALQKWAMNEERHSSRMKERAARAAYRLGFNRIEILEIVGFDAETEKAS